MTSSDSYEPQQPSVELTFAKTPHPADGSDHWSVTGAAGVVMYDVLGNHLAYLGLDGEVIDSAGKRHADRVPETGNDRAVFARLAVHYRREFGGVRKPLVGWSPASRAALEMIRCQGQIR